jgi:ribosomal protein S12 methylthiotransferase accessory factor
MNKKIIKASPDKLIDKYDVIYPPKYHRFLSIQKENYRELVHNSSNPIDWVIGENLVSHKKTYIPRQITSWLGLGYSRIFREKLLDNTSNGCAGYFSKEGAVLRGLLEVIQRDAFLVHWLTQISPDLIKSDTLPEEIKKIIQEFKLQGISIYILDITSIPIPSVCIVAINEESEIPRIVVSGSSDITFEASIYNALKEIIMMARDLHYMGNKTMVNNLNEVKPFISDINKTTRQTYWTGVDKMNQFKWFLSGKEVSYSEVCQKNLPDKVDDSSKLIVCLGVLKELGEGYYPVVYYPKNKIQENIGFYVAQVYIPKAFIFYLNECYGTFDSDRLQEFALSKDISRWELNPFPHMFS